jgi:peptidoglycan L-alanyl-D-glutamate endopeptidase CwlK
MPKFGTKSKAVLDTCHKDIKKIMSKVVEIIDISCISGHRSPAEQKSLFDKGRDASGKVIDKSKVVTTLDGYNKKSKHNESPSHAIDIVPYPEMWSDAKKLIYVAGVVKAVAFDMYVKGETKHLLRWGGDWDKDNDLGDQTFNDYPHFEIYKP